MGLGQRLEPSLTGIGAKAGAFAYWDWGKGRSLRLQGSRQRLELSLRDSVLSRKSKSVAKLSLQAGAHPFKLRAPDEIDVGHYPSAMGRVVPTEHRRQVSHGGVLNDTLARCVQSFERLNHKEPSFDFLCGGLVSRWRKYAGKFRRINSFLAGVVIVNSSPGFFS
jgi:hypothetical protein